MDATHVERLNLDNEQLALLRELLESERAKLLVEVRHTDRRSYRDELRHRIDLMEQLLEHFRTT